MKKVADKANIRLWRGKPFRCGSIIDGIQLLPYNPSSRSVEQQSSALIKCISLDTDIFAWKPAELLPQLMEIKVLATFGMKQELAQSQSSF